MQTQIDFSNVHQNSIDTYHEKVLPTIRGRKLEVLDSIKKLGGKATMHEVGQHLNLPLNNISGRFIELVKMEMIQDSGATKKHGTRNFTIWKLI